MKKGYTLSETLIALTIIGVIAALTLPLAKKAMPDKEKAMFLKTYDSVVEITRTMAENKRIYPIINPNMSLNYDKYPLYNVFQAKIGNKSFIGPTKYCELLAYGLNGTDVNCNAQYKPENAYLEAPSFITPNGVAFWVYNGFGYDGAKIMYRADIFIDVDGKGKGNDCIMGAGLYMLSKLKCANNKKPDRFKFFVSADAMFFPADLQSQKYLDTRTNPRTENEQDFTGYIPLKEIPDDYRFIDAVFVE